MTKTRVPAKDLGKVRLQDRTDWKRVYDEPLTTADRKANEDKDNPVLRKARFRRLKDA